MYRDQRSPSGDVQGGSEFQEVLTALVPTADKNRNSERQPNPLTTFYARLTLIQTGAPMSGYGNVLLAPIGPNEFQISGHHLGTRDNGVHSPRLMRYFLRNQPLAGVL